MKLGLIIPALLTTGGASTFTVFNSTSINYSNADSTTNTNLTIKNIAAIEAEINKSKSDNKIADLTRETLATTTASSTTLNIHYSANIDINNFSELNGITNTTEKFEQKQTELGNLLKEKIQLTKQKDVYEQVKNEFNTNAPSSTQWDIVTDSSTSSCKLQKKSSSTSTTPTTTVDDCSYGWQIMFIDEKEKIKSLLVDNSTLLGKFKAITTTS